MSSSPSTGTDPGSASAGRRATALGLDLLLALVLALLLTTSTGRWLSRQAVTALATDDPAGWWKGPAPMILGMVGSLVYGLPLTVLLVTGAEILFGQSPGKALLGLRIVRTGPGGRALRLLLRDAPWWLALGALLVATPSFTEMAAGVAILWTAVVLLVLLWRGRPLHALPTVPGEVSRDGADQRA